MGGILIGGIYTKIGFSSQEIEEPVGIDKDLEDLEPAEEEKISPEITKIEIYLGGNRDNGIFLGEAKYGLPSEDAKSEYGEDFLNTGYSLIWETTDYKLKEGLANYIYVYAFISGYGWEYIREEIKIPGKSDSSDNIHLYIDRPKDGKTFGGEIEIFGWAADKRIADNPGILDIKVYLNGPEGSGKFLGDADYGIERPDVAEVTRRENWLKSGYSYKYDSLLLEPGSDNTFFIYANSVTGEYRLEKVNIRAEGIAKDMISKIYLDDSFIDMLPTGRVEIKGWAVVEDIEDIIEDKTFIFEDREYENEKVVFVSDRAGRKFDLYISDIDGKNLVQLTDNNVDDLYPTVSPDGEKIAFTQEVGGLWQIMVMDRDGSNLRQLTFSNTQNAYPAYSYDGKYIFYESKVGDVWEVYRIDAEGGEPVRLTYSPNFDDWHPARHTTEPFMLYESGKTGREDILIMDYNGENIFYITNDEHRNRVPDMHPDGKSIVFSRYVGALAEVYIIDIETGELTQITSLGGTNTHPAFSPDGRYIGFDSNSTGKVQNFIYSMEDGSLVNISNDNNYNYKDPFFLFY